MYAHILSGVCFSCDGQGIKPGNPPVQSNKYMISAICKNTNQRVLVFAIKAKNADIAVKKATQTLAKGNGYHADSAVAIEQNILLD